MPNFLDVDDRRRRGVGPPLAAALGRPPRRGAGRVAAWPCSSRSRRPRTRNSTEMAVVDLGGHPVYIQGTEVGLDERETAEDVARTLACYHRVLCARVFDHEVLRAHGGRPRARRLRACRWSTSSRTPPTRARPWPTCSRCASCSGPWPGRRRRPTWATPTTWRARWPRRRVLEGMEVRIAAPGGYAFGRRRAGRAAGLGGRGRAGRLGLQLDEPRQAAEGAAVLYTDVWTSMGQEEEQASRRGGLRRLHRRRGAGGRRRGRRGRAALPARAPGRGDHRRRARGPALGGVAPGGTPPHGHARRPGLGPSEAAS